MKSQLKIGVRIEKEHKNLLPFIKSYKRQHGKWPSQNVVFKKIAQAHIKENPNYYSKLKKARL